MLLQLYKTDFGESYITVVNYNVPIDTVRRVAFAVGFLGLEFGKTDFRPSKKVVIGFLQIHLWQEQDCQLLSTTRISVCIG